MISARFQPFDEVVLRTHGFYEALQAYRFTWGVRLSAKREAR